MKKIKFSFLILCFSIFFSISAEAAKTVRIHMAPSWSNLVYVNIQDAQAKVMIQLSFTVYNHNVLPYEDQFHIFTLTDKASYIISGEWLEITLDDTAYKMEVSSEPWDVCLQPFQWNSDISIISSSIFVYGKCHEGYSAYFDLSNRNEGYVSFY